MKTHTSWMVGGAAILLALVVANEARATVLTFSIFSDSNKTTQVSAGTSINQAYGDNVNNFSPTNAFGSHYFNYGSLSGLTPNVTVEYRQWDSPGDNAGANGSVWTTGYGNLTNVLYPNLTFEEVRFVPSTGYGVRLHSFDVASFGGDLPNQTLKVVRDAGLLTAQTLWSAGPDGTVFVNGQAGEHDAYVFPDLYSGIGHTISLIYANSGNMGLDNVVFSEAIPEPSILLLFASGAIVLWRKRRSP